MEPDPEEGISPVSPRKAKKRPSRPETWVFLKRFFLKRSVKNKHHILLTCEHFYLHEVSTYKFLTKPNATIADIKPTLINPGLNGLVKKIKLSDVKRLLEIHFGPNWVENTSLEYYKTLFEKSDEQEDKPDELEPECEETEESPEPIV